MRILCDMRSSLALRNCSPLRRFDGDVAALDFIPTMNLASVRKTILILRVEPLNGVEAWGLIKSVIVS